MSQCNTILYNFTPEFRWSGHYRFQSLRLVGSHKQGNNRVIPSQADDIILVGTMVVLGGCYKGVVRICLLEAVLERLSILKIVVSTTKFILQEVSTVQRLFLP